MIDKSDPWICSECGGDRVRDDHFECDLNAMKRVAAKVGADLAKRRDAEIMAIICGGVDG